MGIVILKATIFGVLLLFCSAIAQVDRVLPGLRVDGSIVTKVASDFERGGKEAKDVAYSDAAALDKGPDHTPMRVKGSGVVSGPGSYSGFYYGPFSGAGIEMGTSQHPTTNQSAPLAIIKDVDTTGMTTPLESPALYTACRRYAGGTTVPASCQGAMSEAVDFVGGSGTFVEGHKSVGVKNSRANNGGGVYGAVDWAQAPFADYWVANEAQIVRNSGSSRNGAPVTSRFSKRHFSANYLASNGIGNSDAGDVAFLVNPFNATLTQTGFMAPAGVIGQTAFADAGTQTYGLDLSLGSGPHGYAAIALSNNDPIRMKRTDGTYANAMYESRSNQLVIGTDTGVLVPTVIASPKHGASASNYPEVYWQNTGASANNTIWDWVSTTDGVFHLRAVNDTFSAAADAITITRHGATPTVVAMGAPLQHTVSATVSATGTNQRDATLLTSDISIVTKAAKGSGMILANFVGQRQEVFNRGADALFVYPPRGSRIETAAANAAVSIPVGGHAVFVAATTTQIYQAP